MKVKELIELLSQLDQDEEIWKSNWYHDSSPVKKVTLEQFNAENEEGDVELVHGYLIR